MIGTSFTVLRMIPPEARSDLATGALKLTGSVLRRSNGQIAFHLQEAAPMAQRMLTETIGSSPGGPQAMVAQFALSTTSVVQNEVIRRGVNRVEDAVEVMDGKLDLLTQLGAANLALGAAGIGIMVAGFAAMNARLSRIELQMDRIGAGMEQLIGRIEEIRHDQITREFVQIRGLARLFEDSWALTDAGRAESSWRRVYEEGATLQEMTLQRADHHLLGGRDYFAAEPHLEAFALVSGLRIAALLAADEIEPARRIERDSATVLERMTGTIGLADLVRRAIPDEVEPGTERWHLARAAASEQLRPTVAAMRQRESSLATRTSVLPALEARGVRPREWLQMARQETEAPVLILAQDDAEAG